jgi:hypothetical protein
MIKRTNVKLMALSIGLIISFLSHAEDGAYVIEAGHASLKELLLPATPPSPTDNPWSKS